MVFHHISHLATSCISSLPSMNYPYWPTWSFGVVHSVNLLAKVVGKKSCQTPNVFAFFVVKKRGYSPLYFYFNWFY